MTKEAFLRDILDRLKTYRLRHPAMGEQDEIKFVFQAMLGVGHLMDERGKVTDYIQTEMAEITADSKEPLFEVLSPAWCRLHLRRAKAEGFRPHGIAGLMLSSQASLSFSRQDVFDFCSKLTAAGESGFKNPQLLRCILDESWLPSHSSAYREQYRPAYRVISTGWIPMMEWIIRIQQKQAGNGRLLITLDGPCASGKTTLAKKLAAVFEAALVHTDDFVVPHAQKTAARLAIPGGNCDAERLVKEVAAPWKRGESVKYRRYDCGLDRLLPEEELPPASMLILEGSYSSLPAIRKYADLCLFLDAPEQVRLARLKERESAESFRRFLEKWIPLENAYFKAYDLPDQNCLAVRCAEQLSFDRPGK